MKIVVCVKQIPVIENVSLEGDKVKLDGVEQIINPFDEYAIEEGIALKEKYGGEVIILSLGPKANEKSLRQAVSVGADKTVLVQDEEFSWFDALKTSCVLAKAIEKIGDVDLVITGKVATDGDSSQIGPAIAGWLEWPQLMYVKKIEEANTKEMIAWQLTNKNEQKVKVKLPLVISVIKEINEPRLPTLKGKMAAKKHTILTWSLDDLSIDDRWKDVDQATWQVKEYFPKKERPQGTLISGEPEEVVEKFIKQIKEEKIL